MKQNIHDREKQRVRVCGAGAVSVYVCYYCYYCTHSMQAIEEVQQRDGPACAISCTNFVDETREH